MDVEKLYADLAALLADESLFEEANLHARNEAIVFIKYVGDVWRIPGYASELDPLFQHALVLRDQLVAANAALFQQVRTDLSTGNFTPESLPTFFDKFTDYAPGEGRPAGDEFYRTEAGGRNRAAASQQAYLAAMTPFQFSSPPENAVHISPGQMLRTPGL